MKKRIWFLAICLVAFCGIVIAQDATPASADSSSTVITILHHATDIILGILVFLFGWLIKWLIGKAGANEARIRAIEALHAGVEAAWNDLAKKWKNDSADGKLTDEEKAKLREYAMKKALEVAKGPGKDLLLDWGKEIIFAKIRDIITNRKKADVAATPTTDITPAIPVPDK